MPFTCMRAEDCSVTFNWTYFLLVFNDSSRKTKSGSFSLIWQLFDIHFTSFQSEKYFSHTVCMFVKAVQIHQLYFLTSKKAAAHEYRSEPCALHVKLGGREGERRNVALASLIIIIQFKSMLMISNNIICQAFPSESDASASLSHFSPFLLNLGRCILPSPTFNFWSQTFFFFNN